ncbi:hypothetical protein GLYMA_18G232750v4 [Glycine max]|nr:hypothetical protein GLYMA_18G232750v4 [Glycine max]KAH1155797.1 hypothetical protein GYH30_050878 [Glycine max]
MMLLVLLHALINFGVVRKSFDLGLIYGPSYSLI